MKPVKYLSLFSAASLLTTLISAQTADEIIQKHIEAIGGKETISQINSMHMEVEIDVMGNLAQGNVYVLDGKGHKTEINFGGQNVVTCITDKGGWTINPFMGGTDATPMPDAQYKADKDQIYAGSVFLNYAERGSKAELLGKEGSNYKLKLTSSENTETIYYINDSTFYISKTESARDLQGVSATVVSELSDYRKLESGPVIPHMITSDTGQFTITITVKKVTLNPEIDAKIFEMPK